MLTGYLFVGGYSAAQDANPLFSVANWGLCVIDADTKEVLHAHNENRLFIPASITKLFTAVTALEFLGPSHLFYTKAASSEPMDSRGCISGNVYLIGGGDPLLDTAALKKLARQVHEKGVKVIRGQIIADDTLYKPSLPIHSEWEDLVEYYAAELTALSINENVVKARIHPNPFGRGQAKATLEEEVPFCTLKNHVLTVKDLSEPSFILTRGLENNEIEIKGTIPANHTAVEIPIAIHNPQEYARRIFSQALSSHGIIVEGSKKPHVSKRTYELARHSSAPLSGLIQKMNKISHNLIADLLFKYMNRHSDDPLRQLLQRFEIKPSEYSLFDGSGLSRHNLISPLQTVKLIDYALQSPYHKFFLESLPIGAEEDSCLKDRFQNLYPGVTIRAKTGGMTGISCLAGTIELPTGKQLIFALFINNSLLSWKKTSAALDEMVQHIISMHLHD